MTTKSRDIRKKIRAGLRSNRKTHNPAFNPDRWKGTTYYCDKGIVMPEGPLMHTDGTLCQPLDISPLAIMNAAHKAARDENGNKRYSIKF